MTLNNSWGYTTTDHNWKSPQTVVQMLVRVVSKGGNFLLNFGSTAEGEMPTEAMKIMKPVGGWLRVNGEAIYGARPSHLEKVTEFPAVKRGKRMVKPDPEVFWLTTSRPADRSTGQPDRIYLHIFQWPGTEFTLPVMKQRVSGAYMLADPTHTALKVSQNGSGVTVHLPTTAPDPIASVLVLQSRL